MHQLHIFIVTFMALSPYVFGATAENFLTPLPENSDSGLSIKNLPEKIRNHPEIGHLSAYVRFLRAGIPPVSTLAKPLSDNPDDLEARYRLRAV